MNALKAEFRNLIEMTGWSQTETAKRLAKTPGAINHLLNPDHPNNPTQSTLGHLKLIIAREKLDRTNSRKHRPTQDAKGRAASQMQLSLAERRLINRLRDLRSTEHRRIHAIIRNLLTTIEGQKRNPGKKRNTRLP